MGSGYMLVYSSICIVDQPVGTGYSMVDTEGYAKNMVEVTSSLKRTALWEQQHLTSLQIQIMDQFVTFIDKLFEVFPEYKEKEVKFKTLTQQLQ